MMQQTYERDKQDKIYRVAIIFIDKLLKAGINLASINTNDWHCNTEPSVYVGARRYKRLSNYDAQLAIKYMQRSASKANEIYQLTMNGGIMFEGTQNECFTQLVRSQGRSANYVLEFGGWNIVRKGGVK